MSILIATGLPFSHWERLARILPQTGLKRDTEAFTRWHDEIFTGIGVEEMLRICQPLQPGPEMEERAATLISEISSEQALLADNRCLWTLDFWAQRLPNAQFLLFYAPAETALVNALLDDTDAKLILDGWQVAGRELLRFQRHNRRRAFLWNADTCIQHPQTVIDFFSRLGFDMQTSPLPPAPGAAVPMIEHLLARYVVGVLPSVQSMQAELEASAQPSVEAIPHIHLQMDALLNDYWHRQKRFNEMKNKLQTAERTIEEYHHGQQVAEMLRQKLEGQVAELTKIQDGQASLLTQSQIQLDRVGQNLAVLQTEHKQTHEENELLVLQLNQIQEELEETFTRVQQLEQELHRVRTVSDRKIEELLRRVARLKQTVSWRITSPIRQIARLFKRSNISHTDKQEQVRIIKDSGLFDITWYLSQYPEVASGGMDPIEHYLFHGVAEGCNPSPSFDSRRYLEANPDVATLGMNPLLHYIKYGHAEGRKGFEHGKR